MNSILDIHLKEVDKYPSITPKEEKTLALKVMMGNQEAREKLITANMKYVISRAYEYADHGVPIEDLIQEGYVGLCKAADRYDPVKGYKFITFASWWIFQSILQFLTNSVSTVRLPVNKVTEIRKLRRAEEDLNKELGRSPTMEELDDALEDIDVYKLLPWINTTMRQQSYIIDDNDDLSEQEEIDLLARNSGIPFPQPDDDLMSKSVVQDLTSALGTLTDREAKIIRLYYGLDNMTPLTLEDVGELLGLTRERIRQIKNTALGKLAASGHLKNFLS